MRPIKFRIFIKDEATYLYIPDLQGKKHSTSGIDGFEIHAYTGHDVVWQQFTGLYDMRGMEIYEGDLVSCSTVMDNNTYQGRVVYYEKYAAFGVELPILSKTLLFHNFITNNGKLLVSVLAPNSIQNKS